MVNRGFRTYARLTGRNDTALRLRRTALFRAGARRRLLAATGCFLLVVRFVVRRLLVVLRLRVRAAFLPARLLLADFAFFARRAFASARNCAGVARFFRAAMRPPFLRLGLMR